MSPKPIRMLPVMPADHLAACHIAEHLAEHRLAEHLAACRRI